MPAIKKTTIDFRDIRAAMHEALNVEVSPVERPTPVKGVTETWLEVTYGGKHIGWLPADTNPQVAMNTARRWLQQGRRIAHEAHANSVPSAAGLIVNKLIEGRA